MCTTTEISSSLLNREMHLTGNNLEEFNEERGGK
jgi:hypothetical protein